MAIDDSTRFDIRVPTQRGGLDLQVEMTPAPTRETLMTRPFRLAVRAAGELIGEAERTIQGDFLWSASMFGPCSATGIAMIESRVNDLMHAVLRCSLLLHLVARPRRAVA